MFGLSYSATVGVSVYTCCSVVVVQVVSWCCIPIPPLAVWDVRGFNCTCWSVVTTKSCAGGIQVLIVFGCSTAVWSGGVHLVCWSVVTPKS